jgi:hypothetical protein
VFRPSAKSPGLVIVLAPVLSAYCDPLCREYDLRIALIAAFFRREGGSFAEYETFLSSREVADTKWWDLKKATLYAPSLATCVITVLVGLLVAWRDPFDILTLGAAVVAAIIGLVLVVSIQRSFDSKQRPILKIRGER